MPAAKASKSARKSTAKSTATRAATAAKRAAAKRGPARPKARKAASGRAHPKEATAMLRADHKKVSDLFDAYEKARSTARKAELVSTICHELKVHTRIEEEIFYPAVQAALADHELVPEANVEHGSVKELIAQVEGRAPDGDLFDARIKVMSEWVKHHVKEEQNEMFPRARKTRLDMIELGTRMAARKAELLASGE